MIFVHELHLILRSHLQSSDFFPSLIKIFSQQNIISLFLVCLSFSRIIICSSSLPCILFYFLILSILLYICEISPLFFQMIICSLVFFFYKSICRHTQLSYFNCIGLTLCVFFCDVYCT